MKVLNRNSNIELLRIVAMFFVVLHHAVVNSGVDELFDFSQMPTANMILHQWFGMWGKTAINAFVLISGYFMCTSKLTKLRLLKVYGLVQFYIILVWLLLYLSDKGEVFSLRRLISLFSWLATEINHSFFASFLVFYIGIPIYNALIYNLHTTTLRSLAFGMVGVFTIPFTFFGNHEVFNWVFWYVALYFVGAVVRLCPFDWMNKNKICLPGLLLCIIAAMAGVLLYDWNVCHHWPCLLLKAVGTIVGVAESCSIMSFSVGLLLFCVFRNMQVSYSKTVNIIAGTTFGILCIHAASGAMRCFTWGFVFDVKGHYCWWWTLLSAFVVFVVCSVIDYIRKVFLNRLLIFCSSHREL